MKLRNGETLVYKTRSRWIVFVWAVWLASLAALFFFGANYVSSADERHRWKPRFHQAGAEARARAGND